MQQSIVKFYCFFIQTLLNMFRALQCPSSGAPSNCSCNLWFPYECGGGSVLSHGRYDHGWEYFHLHIHTETRGCNGSLTGLLMMGITMPETCWAVSVRQSNKILRLIVASSWVFYLSDWRCTEPQTLNSGCGHFCTHPPPQFIIIHLFQIIETDAQRKCKQKKPVIALMLNVMFCWPCFSIYLCNKNQPDELAGQQTVNWKAQHVPIVVYIYSIPPDDGLQICPKHVDVDWRNKLRINSASSWFSLHSPRVVYFRIATYTHNLTAEHACIKVSRNIWLWDETSSLCRMLCLHGMNFMVRQSGLWDASVISVWNVCKTNLLYFPKTMGG